MTHKTAKKPPLREIPLASVLPIKPGTAYCTMSTGQAWDAILDAAYRTGWVLLELDDNEKPVKAYRRQDVRAN